MVIIHPKYVYKIFQLLISDPNIKHFLKTERILECFMINVLPVPPNSVRLLSNPNNQNHSMNAVYTKAIQFANNYKENI